MTAPLLQVCGLTRVYPSMEGRDRTPVTALRAFDLTVETDTPQITAIVGESGSGKTTLANLILGFDQPTSGEILFHGEPLNLNGKAARRRYRREVQAVFQDPFAAFNPFYRIRHIFTVAARNIGVRGMGADDVAEALHAVGLDAGEVLDKFPHQLSGGQRQRIMIARALVTKPRLIVADEPVSMVDASLRASILGVMEGLKAQGISFIYITHDLSTVWQSADDVHVLYRGHLSERGQARAVIDDPAHPYVRLLVDSVPPLERSATWRAPAPSTEGPAPRIDAGCPFAAACPHRWDRCDRETPPLYPLPGPARAAACHLHDTETPA